MSINSQPTDTLNSVQIPLIYNTTAQIPSGEDIIDAVVTITDSATSESITFIDVPFSTNDDTIFFTAIFIINVSGVAKDLFCTNEKPDVFGSLGGFYNANSPDAVIELDVSIEYFKKDANGIRVTTGITDNATQIKIVNSALQHCEVQNMDAFTSATDRRFLTNRPKCIPICFEDDDFLSYYNDDIDGFQIRTIDDSGSGIEQDIFTVTSSPVGFIDTTGTGVTNINAVSSWIAGGVTIDDAVACYTVQGFVWNPIESRYDPVTEILKYVIVECCDELKCRLFFYNLLGGADGYSFNNTKEIKDEPTSSKFEKYLDVNISNRLADFGNQKFNSRDNRVFTVETNIIDDEFSEWLNELQTSTRVYKYKNGDCISVKINDGENVILSEPEGIVTRVLQFSPSVSRIIQNNL